MKRRAPNIPEAISERPALDELIRFLWHVRETPDGVHWMWTSKVDSKGYGDFWWRGKSIPSHRFAYVTFIGPIPEGMTVNHIDACRVPGCCRPDHLELMTNSDNASDGNLNRWAKARAESNGVGIINEPLPH